jgi:hypothetical protein
MIKTHRFDSTGDAYDASQTDESISNGDVLVVESERVVGVLVDAWPVAVTPERRRVPHVRARRRRQRVRRERARAHAQLHRAPRRR